MDTMRNDRTYITLLPDLNARVNAYAQRLSMTKTQFLVLCVQAGMNSVIRAIFPEEVIPAGRMAEIIREMENLNEKHEKVSSQDNAEN